MLEDNMTVGFCVVCGERAKRQLCIPCQKKYANPDGSRPEWLKEMQNEQTARAKREQENAERVRRGPPKMRTGSRGGAEAYGIQFVSYDQLVERGKLQ